MIWQQTTEKEYRNLFKRVAFHYDHYGQNVSMSLRFFGPKSVAHGHGTDVAVVDRAVARVVHDELRFGAGHVGETKPVVGRQAGNEPLHGRALGAAVDGIGAAPATLARAGVHQQQVAALEVLP